MKWNESKEFRIAPDSKNFSLLVQRCGLSHQFEETFHSKNLILILMNEASYVSKKGEKYNSVNVDTRVDYISTTDI